MQLKSQNCIISKSQKGVTIISCYQAELFITFSLSFSQQIFCHPYPLCLTSSYLSSLLRQLSYLFLRPSYPFRLICLSFRPKVRFIISEISFSETDQELSQQKFQQCRRLACKQTSDFNIDLHQFSCPCQLLHLHISFPFCSQK